MKSIIPFALIVCLMCLAVNAFAAPSASELLGVCVSVPDSSVTALDEQAVADLHRIGVRWVRVEFTADSDGKIDFAAWDGVISHLGDRGIGITALLSHRTCPAPRNQWQSPEYRTRFTQTATGVVSRYKDRIKRWEIWSKPNDADTWLDPESYAELVAGVYQAFKSADSDAVISTGGLSMAWSEREDSAARRYLNDLYLAEAARRHKNSHGRFPWDIVSVSPHAWDRSPSQGLAAALRDNVVSVLARHGEAWKPIWLTEVGWNADPAGPMRIGSDTSRNEQLQARWLADLYGLCSEADRGEYGKNRLVNRAFYLRYSGDGFGLRDEDGRARPACYAFAKLATGAETPKEDSLVVQVADEAGVAGEARVSTVRYAPQRQIYGVHLLEVWTDIEKQVRWTHRLVGDGGFVKCFFTDITHETAGPAGRWIELINRIYQYDMIPFIRLAGEHVGPYWEKPYADGPGDYTSIAQAMKRVVAGLPRKEGVPIYVEVWNEPNLAVEWSGKPNLEEYAQFFVAVSDALRSLNDPDIRILNGGLALSGSATEQMIKAHPRFIDAFDVWSTHPYPQNHPPEYNIIDGTARYREATIDAYRLETEVLERYGRKNVPVMITETGHDLGNRSYGHEGYPIIDDARRADYMMRAFRDYWLEWQEVLAVFPFIFHDSSESGIWANFVWVQRDSGIRQDGWPKRRSLQYDYVANLAKPLDPHGCISGKVLEASLDAPVRGALVRAEPGGHRSETDAFGNYMLPGLRSGTYTLTVQRPNYRFASKVDPVPIDKGQNAIVDLYVAAEGKGIAEGMVTDAITKEPVSGARVTLSPGDVSATTDAKGKCSIRNVTPGWYRITADKEGFTTASQEDVAIVRDESASVNLRMRSGALPGGPNMMANPGFEDGDRDGVGLGWNNADGHAHPDIFSIDRSTQFSGLTSQRIKASLGANNYVWQMTGYGSIKPGAKYILQVWAKADGVFGSGDGASLRGTFLTNDGRHLGSGQSERTLAGTTDWELLTLEIEAPPESQRLQVVLGAHSEQGVVYFDDVYVGVLE